MSARAAARSIAGDLAQHHRRGGVTLLAWARAAACAAVILAQQRHQFRPAAQGDVGERQKRLVALIA
jgi:hypothetical protein